MSKLTDVLFEFLTTPAESLPTKSIRTRSAEKDASTIHVGIGLSFAPANLTVEGLQLIAELLERFPKSPDRQYTFNMLDLNHNAMDPLMLVVVTETMKNFEHQSKDFRLDEIVVAGTSFLDGGQDYLFQRLIQSALKQRVPRQPSQSHRLAKVLSSPDVRNLSLAGNRLGARDFAIIYSTLRYDCASDALSLASTLVHVDPREREECW